MNHLDNALFLKVATQKPQPLTPGQRYQKSQEYKAKNKPGWFSNKIINPLAKHFASKKYSWLDNPDSIIDTITSKDKNYQHFGKVDAMEGTWLSRNAKRFANMAYRTALKVPGDAYHIINNARKGDLAGAGKSTWNTATNLLTAGSFGSSTFLKSGIGGVRALAARANPGTAAAKPVMGNIFTPTWKAMNKMQETARAGNFGNMSALQAWRTGSQAARDGRVWQAGASGVPGQWVKGNPIGKGFFRNTAAGIGESLALTQVPHMAYNAARGTGNWGANAYQDLFGIPTAPQRFSSPGMVGFGQGDNLLGI